MCINFLYRIVINTICCILNENIFMCSIRQIHIKKIMIPDKKYFLDPCWGGLWAMGRYILLVSILFFPHPPHWSNILSYEKTFLPVVLADMGFFYLFWNSYGKL